MNSSYTTVKADDLRVLCKRVIEDIKERREELKEIAIAEAMRPRRWFFFWTKALSREQALSWLDTWSDGFRFLDYPHLSLGWSTLIQTKEILKALEVLPPASDFCLSVEDAAMLHRWDPERNKSKA